MNTKKLFLAIMALTVLGCTGCVTRTANISGAAPNIEAPITAASELIHRDMLQLNKLKEFRAANNPHYTAPTSGPLVDKITLMWSGNPEQALSFVAHSIFFDFKVQGRKPIDPLTVVTDAVNEKAFKVLEDIGSQMSDRADVDIDAPKRLIVLDYKERGVMP